MCSRVRASTPSPQERNQDVLSDEQVASFLVLLSRELSRLDVLTTAVRTAQHHSTDNPHTAWCSKQDLHPHLHKSKPCRGIPRT